MPRSALRKRVAALALLTASTALLTACSTTVNESTNTAGCGDYGSGQSSDAVTATGKIGNTPKIQVPSPIVAKQVEVTQLVAGSGAQVQPGDLAQIGLTYYVQITTGTEVEEATSTGYADSDPSTATTTLVMPTTFQGADDSKTSSALGHSLICRSAGSRYVIAGPIDSVFGTGWASKLGLDTSVSVVAVIDVRARFAGSADGVNQLQTSGLPSVVTAVDGQPGIVLAGNTPPKTKRFAIVKAGGGQLVDAKSTVVVRYSEFTWPSDGSGAQKSLSWDTAALVATIPASGSTKTTAGDEVTWDGRLKGLRVGTQFIFVTPASGSDPALVWVVDVLGVTR